MSTPNPPQPPDAYPRRRHSAAQPPDARPDSPRGAVTTGVLVALIALALALGGVLGWLVSQSSESDAKTVTLTHEQTITITTTGEPHHGRVDRDGGPRPSRRHEPETVRAVSHGHSRTRTAPRPPTVIGDTTHAQPRPSAPR